MELRVLRGKMIVDFWGWALCYLKGPFKSEAGRLKSEQVKVQRALDVAV